METLNDDNSRLKSEAASTQASTGELEALKAKTVSLEATNSSLTDDKTALFRDMEQLRAEKETLTQEKQTLAAEKDALTQEKQTLATEREALVANKDTMAAEKVRLEANSNAADDNNEALKAEHAKQLAGIRQEMDGQLEELKGRCSEHEMEVVDLTSQIEKCSTLKDELKTLSAQLSGEQTAKKVGTDKL